MHLNNENFNQNEGIHTVPDYIMEKVFSKAISSQIPRQQIFSPISFHGKKLLGRIELLEIGKRVLN